MNPVRLKMIELLESLVGEEAIMFSIKTFNPIMSREAIRRDIRRFIRGVARRVLGSRWHKLQPRYMPFVAMIERGKTGLPHAHVFIGNHSERISNEEIIEVVFSLQDELKMDIGLKLEGEARPAMSHVYGSSLVISPVYSGRVFEYVTKEVWQSGAETNDRLMLDVEVFP